MLDVKQIAQTMDEEALEQADKDFEREVRSCLNNIANLSNKLKRAKENLECITLRHPKPIADLL